MKKNWKRISGIACCFTGMAASALNACLVFSVWAHGFDAEGKILWDKEPEFESQRSALPRVLTDVQESGNALQFDGARKRYCKTEEFESDKRNGYSRWKVFWMNLKKPRA